MCARVYKVHYFVTLGKKIELLSCFYLSAKNKDIEDKIAQISTQRVWWIAHNKIMSLQ